MRALLALGSLVAALSVPSDGFTQNKMAPGVQPGSSEAIIYRDRNYQGPAVASSQARPNMGLAWTVGSIRIKRGAWQACERPSFGGRCTTFTESTPNTHALRVQSIRPAFGGGPAPIPGAGAGASLKGMSSEFFPQPSRNGRRALSCASGAAACARQAAEEFCRARGYGYVGNVAQETVAGRIYLADVLCRRSAG